MKWGANDIQFGKNGLEGWSSMYPLVADQQVGTADKTDNKLVDYKTVWENWATT